MSANPPITLLIPCYNAAPFLPRLMDSVRALTRPFAAILCYDDGSTDDTVPVARSLGLEIITGQPNAGVATARNRLAAAARTEWIHFHDADDLIGPQFLERLAPFCNEQHDVVSCDADWVEDQGRKLLIAWRYDPTALERNPVVHLLHNAMGLNSSIIRKSTWEAIGGCDETLEMWEDADVHVRLANSSARFKHVPEVHTYSLRRAGSFSHDYTRSWKCRLNALERYATTLPPGVADQLASEAERAAEALTRFGDKAGTERAVALCRRLGGNPPSTRNPLLRLLKPIVPACILLRWQQNFRGWHSQ